MIKKVDLKKEKYLMFIDTETIGTLNVKESILPFEIGMKILDTETPGCVAVRRVVGRHATFFAWNSPLEKS